MTLQKLATLLLIILMVANPCFSFAAEDDKGAGFVDDSIRDMSMVFGVGAAGAILGLSTLSFVDSPSDHLKNIAVGGAIGIIIGVGVVVSTQATKAYSLRHEQPINEMNYASIAREEFLSKRIAKDYMMRPDFEYHFSF